MRVHDVFLLFLIHAYVLNMYMYLIQDFGVILFLAVKVFFLHNINLFMLDDFEFS